LAKKAPGEKTVVISAKGVQYISEGGGV